MFVELILRETGSSMVPPRTVSSRDRWRHIGKASADRNDGKEKETIRERGRTKLVCPKSGDRATDYFILISTSSRSL